MTGQSLALEHDGDIVREYVSGNRETAASALVHKYKKFVYSTALRYLASYDDADDASQEVFIKAVENLHKFRGDSSIKTWLYRITVNVSTNMLRRRKLKFWAKDPDPEIALQRPDADPTPDKRFENDDFVRRFMKVLTKLPDRQRETFALRYFDELSYEEIADLTGTSIGGLKANYFQATKKIAEIIKSNPELLGIEPFDTGEKGITK